MSWAHIQAAFEFTGECSADALHALRIIAYNIRDNEYAFCGTEYLRRKMGRKSRKTAQTAVNELVSRGYIIRESGKLAGHRNHYYLNIPGAPAPMVCKKEPMVSKIRPQEMSIKYPPVSISPQIRCVNNAVGKRKDILKKEKVIQIPLQPTPPIDSPHFKAHVIRICYDCGASQQKAVEFYERNQAENWAVLDHLPLEIAVSQFIQEWKKTDMRSWSLEALNRIKNESTTPREEDFLFPNT